METETREEKQKHKILEATVRSIALSGFDNVTMQSIALTAGLSKGGLTHYYPSKQELFLVAFQYFFEKIVTECRINSESYHAPIDKLLSFDIIFNVNHRLFKIAHPVLHSFMTIAAHDETYLAIYEKWVETWVDLIGNILKDGIATQSIVCSDIDNTARTISALIQGIATRAFLAPSTHPLDWAQESYRDTTLKLLGCSTL